MAGVAIFVRKSKLHLFVKQTSLKGPSWMNLYKDLQGYLVFLESLGVVYVDLL